MLVEEATGSRLQSFLHACFLQGQDKPPPPAPPSPLMLTKPSECREKSSTQTMLLILVSKLELPVESLGIQRSLGWTTVQVLLDKDPPDAVVGIQMTT